VKCRLKHARASTFLELEGTLDVAHSSTMLPCTTAAAERLRPTPRSHWMSKKRMFRIYGVRGPHGGMRWQERGVSPFQTASIRVQHFKLGWMKPPDFAIVDGEPGA
jgi:hypothetical protein